MLRSSIASVFIFIFFLAIRESSAQIFYSTFGLANRLEFAPNPTYQPAFSTSLGPLARGTGGWYRRPVEHQRNR